MKTRIPQNLETWISKWISKNQNPANGLVDDTKEEVAQALQNFLAKYDTIEESDKNWIRRVRKASLFGFINEEWEEIVPCKFDILWDFENGFAKAKEGESYLYISKDWEEIRDEDKIKSIEKEATKPSNVSKDYKV